MACRLDRALGNIVYRLEALTPTSTITRNRFESYDPLAMDCPLDSAGLRKFYVEWIGTGEDDGATDGNGREVVTTARLHVEYPTCMPYMRLQVLMARDRHDIRKLLRDDDYQRTGWTDENGNKQASDATEVWARDFTGDEINRSERDRWRYSAQLTFWIRESEQ